MATALKSLPTTFRKMVVKKISPTFRDAVNIVKEPLKNPEAKEVLIQNRFVGINASDMNMAAGNYLAKNLALPFSVGLEGVGEVVSVGDGVKDVHIGQAVMYMGHNVAFSEYVYLNDTDVIPIQSPNADFIPLLISGTTASLSLDMCGRITPGDKVLITAAAGGTGHIAVQWAKNAGCHVIGLCSTKEKTQFLKGIGCDRPINYTKENVTSVLKTEYPDGINVIWETIGGEMFDTLFAHLARKGRLIVVGAISSHKEDFTAPIKVENLPIKLLMRSITMTGFLLESYKNDIPHYLSLLVRLMQEKIINVQIDKGEQTSEGPFKGLGDIIRAVEHLHRGKNKGKVVVAL